MVRNDTFIHFANNVPQALKAQAQRAHKPKTQTPKKCSHLNLWNLWACVFFFTQMKQNFIAKNEELWACVQNLKLDTPRVLCYD